jgi:N-acetylmuramoyl-L-alanine amidase CwlA
MIPHILGDCLSIPEWIEYIRSYSFGPIRPDRIVLHHTWRPTVEQWRGSRTLRAIQRYYGGKGWTAGPHLFCAPDGIWLFTPMNRVGIHAGAGNGSLSRGWYSIGVEMVGDYDHQRPSGRVLDHTCAVLIGLEQKLSLQLDSKLYFHRDFSPKTCPGRAVTRSWVLSSVEQWRHLRWTDLTTRPSSGREGG